MFDFAVRREIGEVEGSPVAAGEDACEGEDECEDEAEVVYFLLRSNELEEGDVLAIMRAVKNGPDQLC